MSGYLGAVCVFLAAASGVLARADSGPHAAEDHTESKTPMLLVEGRVVGAVAPPGLEGVSDGLIVEIAAGPASPTAHRINVALPERGSVSLDLHPIAIRSADYTLREQLADGAWRFADPGPETTYTGAIAGDPGAYVAASWTVEGFLALIALSDGRKYWVQPLRDFLPAAPPEQSIVYAATDTRCAGFCGMPDVGEPPVAAPDPGGVAGTCGGAVCVAQLACDADVEYYIDRGSSSFAVQDRIHAIINVMNHQYVREAAITHVITTVLVRTAEPDPYSSSTSDTLMCQVITEWTINQNGVPRDLTKLFTGREISGSTVGQAANIGQVCDNDGFCTAGLDNGAYCYSQSDFSTLFACQTDVAAHQIGHLWGAQDCNCPGSTMHTAIACVNTFNNSGGVSVAQIDAFADTLACLTTLSIPPANDTCDDATDLPGVGTYQANNTNAGTDGGALGCGALSGNVGGGARDVFFRVLAAASGPAGVELCGSNFDTMLSIHTGCPATPENQIACNDDCGGTCGLDSCVTFTAAAGVTYYIRAAGYSGATGTITLTLSGPFPPGNDACGQATPVQDGTETTGSLALATNDGSASCGTSATNPDVWYTFTAGPCGGALTVDTCGTNDRLGPDTGMDTVVSIHSACPGTNGNQLVCNDDAAPACPGDAGLRRDSRAVANLAANQSVFIRVSHFGTALDDGFFLLDVAFDDAAPLPPVVAAIADESHPCGDAYTGPTPAVINPQCMSPVTWTLVSGPAGMTINATTGVVTWPSPSPTGSPHTVTVRATNAAGNANETWMLDVSQTAPQVQPIPNAAHPCGSPYAGPTPLLTDATCMLPITAWTLIEGPVGMTIDAATGVISWPAPVQTGSPHLVMIRATNSAGSDDETWRLVVGPIAPIIEPIENETRPCTTTYIGPVPALTAPDCMNPATWSLDTGPAGMTINAATGVLTWPGPVAGSLSTIVIRATNAAGFDTEGWRLAIEPTAPAILDIPDATVSADLAYIGPTPALSDPDCMQPISAWTLASGPVGMTIDAAIGVVSWPAPTTNGSPHAITIQATNATDRDDESWLLTVSPAGCPAALGDADCDGLVNFFDIDPFITALFDLAAYQTVFCGGATCAVDVNCDGLVNFFDIDPFVECLFLNCAACP